MLSIFRRFKMATGLNIAGLSVAFAAFLVINIQYGYEYNYDRFHSTSERVYRVDTSVEGVWGIIHSRAFVEAVIRSSPHIEAATLINPFLKEIYFSTEEDGEKKGFRRQAVTCHADITRVFDFPLVQGTADCLTDPEKILIPLSLAQKLFGEEEAVGKIIHAEEVIWSKTGENFTVGGVYRDFPENSQLKNAVYTRMDANYDIDNWDSSNYICYLLLDSPESAETVTENFNATFDFDLINWDKLPDLAVELVPLTDIYYRNETGASQIVEGGSRESARILLGIGILVIVIAGINFTNFSTALAPMRIKSVNVRKVLGSADGALRRSLLLEAVGMSFVSFLLGVGIVYVLNRLSAFSFLAADLNVENNLRYVALVGAASLLVGLAAGLYPARYITSFPPALALKGHFGLSPKGRRLRTALIGFQFVVSVALIVSSLFIRLQKDYMQRFSTGFDTEQVAIVEINADMYRNHLESYRNRLLSFSGIDDVAFAQDVIGGKDGFPTYGLDFEGVRLPYFRLHVSPNFLSVMKIPVVEGRAPSEADLKSGKPVFLFNRRIREAINLKQGMQDIGESQQVEVAGFTDNLKITSLRSEDHNIAFYVNSGHNLTYAYIRLRPGTDVFAAVDHIRESIGAIDPGFPVDVTFYDEVFNRLYLKELNLNRIITLFSLLAIILSITGVFGLIVFETEYRRREIGVRKVFGATVGDILQKFNRTYLRIVTACFVIAAPIAWYGVHKWLENFSYKTPMHWWVFLIAFVAVAGITLLTVTLRSLHAANENPVESVKSE
ncbi:MAG: ABC transporter permease [Tannerellaceae bacterium]|jgi:putative ABC transport system permease protein|nr:ABC transporter permease [Tannerellaceae bacterium]